MSQSRQKKRPRSANRRGPCRLPGALFRGLTSHRVFDQADHDGNDGTGDAPAHGLSDNSADVNIPGRSSEHRQECRENLPAANAAECTLDSVAGHSKIVVLEPIACSISADGACYQLDDDVDDSG